MQEKLENKVIQIFQKIKIDLSSELKQNHR